MSAFERTLKWHLVSYRIVFDRAGDAIFVSYAADNFTNSSVKIITRR